MMSMRRCSITGRIITEEREKLRWSMFMIASVLQRRPRIQRLCESIHGSRGLVAYMK